MIWESPSLMPWFTYTRATKGKRTQVTHAKKYSFLAFNLDKQSRKCPWYWCCSKNGTYFKQICWCSRIANRFIWGVSISRTFWPSPWPSKSKYLCQPRPLPVTGKAVNKRLKYIYVIYVSSYSRVPNKMGGNLILFRMFFPSRCPYIFRTSCLLNLLLYYYFSR